MHNVSLCSDWMFLPSVKSPEWPEGCADTVKTQSVCVKQHTHPPVLLWANQRLIFHLVLSSECHVLPVEEKCIIILRRFFTVSSAVFLGYQTPPLPPRSVPAGHKYTKWKSNIHICLCRWKEQEWRSTLAFYHCSKRFKLLYVGTMFLTRSWEKCLKKTTKMKQKQLLSQTNMHIHVFFIGNEPRNIKPVRINPFLLQFKST